MRMIQSNTMRVPTDGRKMCAIVHNYDLERLLNIGRNGCLSLRQQKQKPPQSAGKGKASENPPLFMDGTTIANNETLKGLGFIIDSKSIDYCHIQVHCII